MCTSRTLCNAIGAAIQAVIQDGNKWLDRMEHHRPRRRHRVKHPRVRRLGGRRRAPTRLANFRP